MSYREVKNCIEEGRLEEAFAMAKKDFENDNNEWTCLALFEVLKHYCMKELERRNEEQAEKLIRHMEALKQGLADPAKADRIINSLRLSFLPYASELNEALRNSRQSGAIDEYETFRAIANGKDLDERLHENYGQLIYYYLRDGLRVIGAKAANEALEEYITLSNPRPSALHSSIVNMATHVCTEYADVKLLPFIKAWDVRNLTEDDMKPVQLSERTISPLYTRLVDRCISLGYHLNDIADVFLANENIKFEEIIDRFCRKGYSAVYEQARTNRSRMMDIAQRYVDEIQGQEIQNQYHSKMLQTLLGAMPEEQISMFATIMEKWGFRNFREEDWQKVKKGPKEYPSLAQKALQAYQDSIKMLRVRPSEDYELWLREALKHDPKNDMNQRQLARILMSRGENQEAVAIYRKILVTLNKFYTWHELAQATDDRDLKRSALCKALLSDAKEEMTGEVHLALAELLVEDGKLPEAAKELLTYYNIYTQHQWRLKPRFDELQKSVAGVEPTQSNKAYYLENVAKADEFILGDILTTETKALEIVKRSDKFGNKYTMVTLLDKDCNKFAVGLDKMPPEEEEKMLLGKSYLLKYAKNEAKTKILSVDRIEKDIDLSSLVRVGYVDGIDRGRNWFHIYDKDSAHFVCDNPSVTFNIGEFVEFIPIIPTDNNFKTAIVTRRLEYREGVAQFDTKLAIIARIDYNKHLFNCVCEDGSTGMVAYEPKSVPNPGEMLRVAYIRKKDKTKENVITKYISIEPSNEESVLLSKEVEGPIHLLQNDRGFEYGFITFEDYGYYVSGYMMKDKNIAEGDRVKAKVVNNGDKWFAFSVTKVE